MPYFGLKRFQRVNSPDYFIVITFWTSSAQNGWIELRDVSKLKNVPKSGKSPKGGQGSAPEIKQSTIQNVDFWIRGGHIFIIFPNASIEQKIS